MKSLPGFVKNVIVVIVLILCTGAITYALKSTTDNPADSQTTDTKTECSHKGDSDTEGHHHGADLDAAGHHQKGDSDATGYHHGSDLTAESKGCPKAAADAEGCPKAAAEGCPKADAKPSCCPHSK